jgi:hypothetical protein
MVMEVWDRACGRKIGESFSRGGIKILSTLNAHSSGLLQRRFCDNHCSLSFRGFHD